MLNWWESVILGIVEGITEFLPVSSTGHLTVVEKLLGKDIEAPTLTAYTAIIQTGAILAAIIFFWRDITRIVAGWFRGITNKERRDDSDYRMGWAVIVATFVTGVLGLLGSKLIEGPFRSLWVVVGGLILWSIAMVIADRTSSRPFGKRAISNAEVRGEDSITIKDGLILGLVQCISLVPGVSRSGATIVGGLLRGLDRVTATRVSFFMGIPALVAAGGYELIKNLDNIGGAGEVSWLSIGIGWAVSFAVAYASIAWLLRFVQRNNFTAFVIYRVAIALVIVGLLVGGVISPV